MPLFGVKLWERFFFLVLLYQVHHLKLQPDPGLSLKYMLLTALWLSVFSEHGMIRQDYSYTALCFNVLGFYPALFLILLDFFWAIGAPILLPITISSQPPLFTLSIIHTYFLKSFLKNFMPRDLYKFKFIGY